jgi:diguanylate cyclase (GGDEF)-like protein/PAS domain S-box-containing protein
MKNISLRLKMIVSGLLIVLIPLSIAGIVNFSYVSRSLEAAEKKKATLVAENLAHLVRTSLEGELKVISVLAADPQVAEAVSSGKYGKPVLAKMKITFQNLGGYLEGAFITDKAGIIRVDAVDAERHGLDLSDRDYFLKAKAGIATISDPVFSKVSGNPIVIISAPIMVKNRFLGMAASALKIDYLLNHISAIRLGKTGYPFMINGKGIVIAHANRAFILKKDALKTAGVETIVRRMVAQESGTEEYVYEGEQKMAGFAPAGIAGWSVAITQNREEFLAPARAVISNVMVLLPVVLIATLVIGVMAVRGLSQPILDLNEATKGLAEGRWQQVADTGRKDELGEVVRSFNSMSEQLQRLFLSLQESEAKYRQIVDTAREGIWVFGPDWKTTFVNARMAQMLGCEEKDIVGRPPSHFLFPEDVPDHNDRIARFQPGVLDPHERRFRAMNGDVLWTIVSVTTIFDSDGGGIGAFAMLTDITTRKQAEEELITLNRELERRVSLRTAELASQTAELEYSLLARDEAEAMLNRLYVAIESGSTAVVIADAEQLVLYANPAAEVLSGYSVQEILGQSLWMVLGPSDQKHIVEQAMESINAGHTWRTELNCSRKDGNSVWLDISLSGILDEKGFASSFVGLLNDITEKHSLQQHLIDLSYRDGLTGISNRRQFDNRLDEEWRRCGRLSLPLSLIMIDIDCFKLYNDTWGHLNGDECLRKVARCVENLGQRRAGDLAARFGGEEFAVLLPGTDADGASIVAQTILAAVEALNLPHPASLARDHVTISLGVACATPLRGEHPQILVAASDRMLYEAKSNGRNRVSVSSGTPERST